MANPIRALYKSFIISDIKNTEEEPDVDAWYAFLASLKEPKDCFEAAYNKYLCRKQYVPEKKTRLLDAAAMAVLAASALKLHGRKEPLPKKEGNCLLLERKPDVDYRDVLPPELPGGFDRMEVCLSARAPYGAVSREGLALFRETVRRYPREYYFQLWVLKELAAHCAYIRKYNPSATAVYINERNVASPILRRLYEDGGRKLISFMHGEYLLQMIQAYMAFSEFYVWDEQYIPMFRDDLHCGIGKYIVTAPLKMTKKWHLEEIEPTVYCTYYFSGESTTSVRKLGEIFRKMEASGKKCLVRPHPRYSHLSLIEEVFPPEMIERPAEVSMEASLARTRYAAGLHTTVLSEAQIEGREAVIDDLSDPEQFRNLKKRKFVVLGRPHRLLSEII